MFSSTGNTPCILDGKYVKGAQTWGTHAYIVFKRFYQKYIDIFQKYPICDHDVFNSDPDILAVSKNLFIQKNIDSNTIGGIQRDENRQM